MDEHNRPSTPPGEHADADAPLTRRQALDAERAGAGQAEQSGQAEQRGHPDDTEGSDALPPEWFETQQEHNGPSVQWRLQHYPSRHRPRRRLRALWVTLIVVAVLAAATGGGYLAFRPQIDAVVASFQPDDYTGTGTGTATITIAKGDIGSDVAQSLADAGVTKTAKAFYRLLLDTSPAPVFHPGEYRLKKHMSAAAALAALQDPKNRVESRLTIPEGTAEATVLKRAAKATGLSLASLTSAAKDVSAYGLPDEAKSLEGFLFPATYTFDPGVSAKTVISTMVDRAFQALDDAGVPKDQRWHTVVLASIVQREAGPNNADFGKIARVLVNRLDQGMLLQSDATVTYGTGNYDTVWTTDAERGDASNPYNTYVHHGLPPGPIGNPGDTAIQAALNPTPGPWLFFVTVNLKTGKTVFSTTLQQHQAAVERLQEWCHASKENSAYC